MEKKKPKILIVTVSAWNSKVGANTWTSLLDGWDSENVAHLCIRDEQPDSKIASRYFAISENKVIKSVLKRGIKTGVEKYCLQESPAEASDDLSAHNERYKKMKKKRSRIMLMARELVWKFGKWHTKELDEFLDSVKPDIILHSMEGYIHLNRIILHAIKRTGAKAVGYIWDDNFTYKQSDEIGYKVYRYFQRKSLIKLAKHTSDFFAISEMTKRESDEFFGIDCKILTKPLSGMPVVEEKNVSTPMKMLYTGNLFIGRDRSLVRVVEAVKKLPEGSFVIDVYTKTELSDEIKAKLDGNICHIHAPIPQAQVLEKQKQTDLLLFLEDMDGPDSRVARLSFSTKITDYLSAGKCIVAVGHKETAPMQYFINNEMAVCAGNDDELEEGLRRICEDSRLLSEYAEKAAQIGVKNHDIELIKNTFNSVIQSVYEN